MSKYNTDISPAITELKKLHNLLLDHIEGKLQGQFHTRGMNTARDTVISILPGERRREDGWYRWRMWEKKSDAILHELESSHKIVKYHEIFIAGEALSRSREEIVLLMMHQVAHQAAAVESVQSYHGEWIKIWMDRLFGIPQEAVSRDEVMGWYKVDETKLGNALPLVQKIAAKLAPEKFDLFRLQLTKRPTTGKMYKWTCSCKKPVLRTGGIPRMTCNVCGQLLKIHKQGVPDSFWKHIPEELRHEEE